MGPHGVLRAVLGPHSRKRCADIGEGSKEVHKNDFGIEMLGT